jgi:hypothetical protein
MLNERHYKNEQNSKNNEMRDRKSTNNYQANVKIS